MPHRASFAEVSWAVTKKTCVKPELRRRTSSVSSSRIKQKNSSKNAQNSDTPSLDEIAENNTPEKTADAIPEDSETVQEAEASDKTASLAEEPEKATETAAGEEEGNDAHVIVLGEEAHREGREEDEGEEEGEGEEGKNDEDDKEEEEKKEGDAARRLGRFKKLTKKQLRQQRERLEEEQGREERRKRREERKRKKELAAQLALQEAPQCSDEAAFKESIYTMVKSSLGLVMTQQGDLNITVDNLTPLMKGLELDTSDENVKDLIMDALFNSYGLVEPAKVDELLLKKKLQSELDDLEECVDAAFAVIDQDRDGLITHNDVYRLMIKLGEVLWDNQVAAMFQAADVDGDGRISKKDLFLFLLGQEKRAKLEDQILNKFANKGEEEATSTAQTAATTTTTTTKTTDTPAPTISQQCHQQEDSTTGTDSAANKTTSLAAALKAAPPSGDSQASQCRRKMFSGYAKLVVSMNRVNIDDGGGSGSGSGDVTELKEEKEDAGDRSHAKDGVEKPDVVDYEDVTTRGDNASQQNNKTNDSENQQQKRQDSSEQRKNDYSTPPQQPSIKLVASDWSDSGHVGSDAGVFFFEEEELQLECAPLALEAGICYLPAPEFDAVASPGSQRTPRSGGCITPTPQSAGSTQLDGDAHTTTPTPLDHERADVILHSARTERTSEYDSERGGGRDGEAEGEGEGDADSLPETSHQNLILQEIEQQVLQIKEALGTTMGPGGRSLVAQRAVSALSNDPGDGCESVDESEIHPTYVPPCARFARHGLRGFLEQGAGVDLAHPGWEGAPHEVDGVPTDDDGLPSGKEERQRRRRRRRGTPEGEKLTADDCSRDAATDDYYANSTAEIISKGYVSLSSPRYATSSVGTTKLPLNDLADDVFVASPHDQHSPPHADFTPAVNGTSFARNLAGVGAGSGRTPEEDTPESKGWVEVADETRQDSGYYAEAAAPMDGVPVQLRPTCDRARKLSARSRPRSSLRRSLTCHTVTVKDLSKSFHGPLSPPRKDTPRLYVRRKSFLRSPSSQRTLLDSRSDGRDYSHVGRDSSTTRKDCSVSRRDASAVAPQTPQGPQTFDFRRTQSLGRMSTPHRHSDPPTRRVYSPAGQMDSHQTQGLDSSRSHRKLSRSRTSSIWSQRETTRPQRLSGRSGREGGRRHPDSHRGRHDFCRARSASGSSTARFGVQTDRSVYHDDDEEDDEEDEEEKEFRFYGPNFDLIMKQKGEPEELLHESLQRDAIFRAGAQHVQQDNEDCLPTATETRRLKISQQLQRIKEMEELIRQRRERMEVTDGADDDRSFADDTPRRAAEPGDVDHCHRCPLRRAKTALSVRSPHTARSALTNASPSRDKDADPGSEVVRPRSCLARRRTMSMTIPKVVTIADSGQEVFRPGHRERASTFTGTDRVHCGAGSQTRVHVVDLSSLLFGVSEPGETFSAADTSITSLGQEQNRRSQSIRPLTRVLVAYEKSRQRLAEGGGGRRGGGIQDMRGESGITSTTVTNPTNTTTSISRQLERGIPYRPPTPPQYSEPPGLDLCPSASPASGGRRSRDSHSRSDHGSGGKRSFVLAAVPPTPSSLPPPPPRPAS